MVTVIEEWPRWVWTALGLAGGDEEAGAGVAEVVDAQAVGESGLFDGWIPDAPPEVSVAERCAVG